VGKEHRKRNLLCIILIRGLHLAAHTVELLFCRADIPRVLERRIARQSRCWAFPTDYSGKLAFAVCQKVGRTQMKP
jgi:hypothetical protein